MGGKDKPLLNWLGKPMVDHVLNSVPEQMPHMISANRNISTYATKAAVVSDSTAQLSNKTHSGPLNGILAALAVCETEWLLVAPGDAPQIPQDWSMRLMQTAGANDHHAVAHDGKRQQHLHLLLKRTVADSLRAYLEAGYFQVFMWLQEIKPITTQFEDPLLFSNINKPQDLTDPGAV